jgi:ligand-binding sensor domain-containing protein
MDIKTNIPIKIIDRRNGLPSGQVHDLVQDAEGVLWLAGPSGLVRYDGSRISVYGRNQGLQTHGLRSIAANKNRKLFIGSDVGIDVLEQDGTIHPLISPEKWNYGFVECLWAGSGNTLWIGTARGLLSWSEQKGLQTINYSKLVIIPNLIQV